jgi:hypothetical protein
MTNRQPQIGHGDAVAIGFLAVLVRLAHPVVLLGFQFAAVAAGVMALLAAAKNLVLPAIAYAVGGWVLWWVGAWLTTAVAEHPIDRATPPQKEDAAS